MKIAAASMLTVCLCLASAGLAMADPVDLSTWNADSSGGANWTLSSTSAPNDSVFQSVNGAPTIFHDDSGSSQGNELKGTIKVETTSDDDFIGFVLGYHDGDISNSSADYILIDWKQAYQVAYGTGLPGLAISRVSGVLGNNSGPWAHDPNNNVTELARATNLGSTGWANNTEYEFELVFTSTLIEVYVDGVKEISEAGTFADGGFGFYNFSQARVRYAGITTAPAPNPVPEPTTLALLGLGFAGLGAARRRRRQRAA